MNLIFLLFLHHVGDVWAQPSWLIKLKHKHLFSIYEHVFLYSGIVSLGFYALGLFEPWIFFWLFIGHFIIDSVKYRVLSKDYNWIYPDQLLHYLQIVLAYFLVV